MEMHEPFSKLISGIAATEEKLAATPWLSAPSMVLPETKEYYDKVELREALKIDVLRGQYSSPKTTAIKMAVGQEHALLAGYDRALRLRYRTRKEAVADDISTKLLLSAERGVFGAERRRIQYYLTQTPANVESKG